METTHNKGRRWLSHLLPFLMLVAVACSGEDAAPVTSGADTTQPPPSSTTAPATVTTPVAPTTTTLGPGDVFTNGLTASIANYRFESTVAAGDQVITSISGVVDSDAISADISAGDRVVSYVRTGEGEWLTDSEGEWVEVEGQPPVAPPLGLLTDATSFEEVSVDQGTVVLAGTLGAAAGAAGGIPFTVTIIDGLISQIQYQAETGGETAVVTTTFTEIGTAGGITPPEV
jgi:hypothetical protein